MRALTDAIDGYVRKAEYGIRAMSDGNHLPIPCGNLLDVLNELAADVLVSAQNTYRLYSPPDWERAHCEVVVTASALRRKAKR